MTKHAFVVATYHTAAAKASSREKAMQKVYERLSVGEAIVPASALDVEQLKKLKAGDKTGGM